MNSLGRIGLLFSLALLFISPTFADDKTDHPKDTAKSDAPAVVAEPAPAAKPAPASSDGPPAVGAGTKSLTAAPRPAGKSGDDSADDDTPTFVPMPAISGNPGMFTLETGDILPKGAFNLSAGVSKVSRMPGDITALESGPSFGVGLTNWLSASIQFDANTHIHVDEPSLLSLAPVNAGNNQYGNTIYPSVLPAQGFRPAYVEEFPFASHNGGGVGEIDLAFKIGLLSEHRGNPVSLSIRNDFYIPTETSFASLIANQVQYGKFNYGIGVEASKTVLHNAMVATINWDYRFTRDSSFTPVAGSPAEVLNLSDQMHVGVGLLMFPNRRFNVISEYSAVIFVGNGIPNTTFGARDPVDNVSGFRVYLARQLAFEAGYRYNLNLTNHLDRNGFVLKLSAARYPEEVHKRVPDTLSTTCSVDKPGITEGSNDAVQASAMARDSYGHPLSYTWTASGGAIAGTGPVARWDSTGVAAGSYTLSVHVDDGNGQTSACSTSVTVQPR
jgi:hypothetical protein